MTTELVKTNNLPQIKTAAARALLAKPEEYLLKFSRRYTAQEAIYNERDLTLGECEHTFGLTHARAIVVLIIGELTENINVGKNMSDRQVATLAQDILDMYYYFNLGELMRQFVLMRQKGDFYDRLDGNVILRWLSNYDNRERCEICERVEQEKAKQYKAEYKAPIEDEEYIDFMRRITQNKNDEREA